MAQRQRSSKPVYRRSYARKPNGGHQQTTSRPTFWTASKLLILLAIAAIAIFLATKAFAVFMQSDSANANVVDGVTSSETGFDSTIVEGTPERTVTLSFAGDCTLGTDVNFDATRNFDAMYKSVGDLSYFLANVEPIFREDDITVVNMEGTLTELDTRVNKKFAFKGPLEYAEILPLGGVEVASFANNHDSDYGTQSHSDTVEALEGAGIVVASEDKIAYMTANGVKVAIIGVYELDDHREREEDVKRFISTARSEGAELVVVFYHWGNEREYSPDENQIYMGHMAIDEGADMVIGSHPHVIQGYENYNGRYIFYSLGNFCYGGHSNPADKDSMIVQKTFIFGPDGIRADDDVNVIPCSISSSSTRNNYQPTPAEGAELDRMLAKIEELNDNVQSALASYKG